MRQWNSSSERKTDICLSITVPDNVYFLYLPMCLFTGPKDFHVIPHFRFSDSGSFFFDLALLQINFLLSKTQLRFLCLMELANSLALVYANHLHHYLYRRICSSIKQRCKRFVLYGSATDFLCSWAVAINLFVSL